MIGLYAVTLRAPPGALGARGEVLRELRLGEISLLAGAAPPMLSVEALRAHEAAVRRIAEACEACLPARFGVAAENDESLLSAMRSREPDLMEALKLVSGREQMTLRIYEHERHALSRGAPPRAPHPRARSAPRGAGGSLARGARRAALRAGPARERLPPDRSRRLRRLSPHRRGHRASRAARQHQRPLAGVVLRARARPVKKDDVVEMQVRELESLRKELERRVEAAPRWNADPKDVQKSVARLVLALIEFLRKLLEKQAIRRMESGTLSEEETEAVGLALMRLEETVHELARRFGLKPEDLNLDLGPLGRLI